MEALTKDGENNFLIVWKTFEFPTYWPCQQNPISHRTSYFMSDTLRLIMMIPFLLHRFLKARFLKNNIIQSIKEYNQLWTNSQVVSMIKQCWVKFAACSKAIFANTMSNMNYANLEISLQNMSNDLLKVKIYSSIIFIFFKKKLLLLVIIEFNRYFRKNSQIYQIFMSSVIFLNM